ncbi:hypothetical protein JOC86_001279 [Bacillus pakistanensis]|uniref:DUF3679 domain-containing protein n=1 Tax=Rossellomorea pakistanensis TaxID=992288 RepID=A0ABS2NA65_9BACI|nr:DUF3679 domain-containing protein [Bacillus pakistanensis]MBM7584742.1 hypothetical protein [Bacillus pakistanensis]
MKRFMIKSILLISFLFIGVLIGMQKANDGILEMKGQNGHSLHQPLSVEQNEQGNMEASLLGNEVSSETLSEKKEKLEEMKAFNFFSSIGKAISDFVTSITEKIIQIISSLL